MNKRGLVFLPLILLLASVTTPSALAATQQCTGQHNSNNSNWQQSVGTGTIFHGVSSYIDPYDDSSFGYCFGGGVGVSSAWVAIVPGVGNSHANDTNAIMQIGLVKGNCSVCGNTSGKFRYFIADGGCGLPEDQPTLQVVGNASSYVQHKYRLERGTGSSAGWWYAYVDSALMWQWAPNDPHISCWLESDLGHTAILISGERYDLGDSSGTAYDSGFLKYLYFTSMNYKSATTDNWIHFNFSSSLRDCSNYGGHCTVYQGDPGYYDAMQQDTH